VEKPSRDRDGAQPRSASFYWPPGNSTNLPRSRFQH
jgi:hypothetical protein